MATLHYTAGNNISAQGTYAPAAAGFNLADVSSVSELNALPAGVQGMVYLDQGSGVTQSFMDAVSPYIGNPKVYGFYLKDEPDPTGQYNTLVTAANLQAESDYIHANVPGAKTFITMMNMGSSENPTFADTYNPANTHVDLFGIDPYPVRSDMSTVDYGMIDRAVVAAESAGIPVSQIVPVFQTFGGGNWADDSGGQYVMPTAAQEQTMLAHWAAAVPNPAFDYAYAWGSQNGDTALESSPALQNVFLQHNTATSTTLPAVDTSGSSMGSSSGSTTSALGSIGGTTTAIGDTGITAGVGTTTAGGGTTTGTSSGATTGSSSGNSSSGSTSTTAESGHHHQGLDFSQLTTGGAGSSSGSLPTATTSTVTETGDAATGTTSTGFTDAGAHLVDQIGYHTDHHAWHF